MICGACGVEHGEGGDGIHLPIDDHGLYNEMLQCIFLGTKKQCEQRKAYVKKHSGGGYASTLRVLPVIE